MLAFGRDPGTQVHKHHLYRPTHSVLMKSSQSKVALLPEPTHPLGEPGLNCLRLVPYLKRKANIFQAGYAIEDLNLSLK